MIYNLLFFSRAADPQTLNLRGNEPCRMSLTFARTWRIPCPVCGAHSLAIGEYSNTLFTLHCWLVCVMHQLSPLLELPDKWHSDWWNEEKPEPNPSVLTWEDFHVNKQLIGFWINAPKAVASKQLCCGCLECCHLVHIWFPSFLKSPTLFHDHDLILKIPSFFFFLELLPAKGPVINLLQQAEHGKSVGGQVIVSFGCRSWILYLVQWRNKEEKYSHGSYGFIFHYYQERIDFRYYLEYPFDVIIINMDLIEPLLILPLIHCPTVCLGINFPKRNGSDRHLKKLSTLHQTPRVICCLRETKAL